MPRTSFGLILVCTLLFSDAEARAETLRIGIDGLHCAADCPPRATKALEAVEGVDDARVDFASGTACLETSGDVSEDQLSAALGTETYTLTTVEAIEGCEDRAVSTEGPRDPWDDTEGVDAAIISHGETFDMAAERVPEKFTIFDFGAAWCGPCHTAADRLREVMPTQPDIAVRAISLGEDAHKTFELPVVAQHLAFAQSIPWFVVMSPSGKKVYEGDDVEAALAKIAKKRK